MSAQHGKASDLPPATELVNMLDAGATYEEIAEDHGCSPITVRQHVNDSGLLRRKVEPVEPDDDVIDLASLVPQGDLSWQDRGLCAQTDPEEFFPDKGGATRYAKAICAVCPVQAECLDYALANDERFGVWGGTTERDRRKIKRALADEAGIERVPCDRCSETFTRQVDLARHVKATHERVILALPCPACDHVATTQAGAKNHIHRKHPDYRTAS